MSPRNYTLYEHFDNFLIMQKLQQKIKINNHNIIRCKNRITVIEDRLDSVQTVITLESSPDANSQDLPYWRQAESDYNKTILTLKDTLKILLAKKRQLYRDLLKLEMEIEM